MDKKEKGIDWSKHRHTQDLVCEYWCCWLCRCGWGAGCGHKLYPKEIVMTENPHAGSEESKFEVIVEKTPKKDEWNILVQRKDGTENYPIENKYELIYQTVAVLFDFLSEGPQSVPKLK